MKDRDYQNIPGWELVNEGLKDIAQGSCHTSHALLILMAAPRLRFLGIRIPSVVRSDEEVPFSHELYGVLENTTPDAYSQYNALQRRLVSFCHAVENIPPSI